MYFERVEESDRQFAIGFASWNPGLQSRPRGYPVVVPLYDLVVGNTSHTERINVESIQDNELN